MIFDLATRRLLAYVALALAVPCAGGCLDAYNIRLDVRSGPEQALRVAPLPLGADVGAVPIKEARVRFRLPWYWGYTGAFETGPDGVVSASFTDRAEAVKQTYRRWFYKGPDERVVHFSCEKDGHRPVVGSFPLAVFRAWEDAPARTVLVIMVPRKLPGGPPLTTPNASGPGSTTSASEPDPASRGQSNKQ